jgi:hypothetical protein
MVDISVHKPDLGIDGSQSHAHINDRSSVDGTQNVDYDLGIIATPPGFTKLSGGSALDSGNIVTGFFQYIEANGDNDFIVTTEGKSYVHNRSTDSYDEISGATLTADVIRPVSFAQVLHQDALSGEYKHLIVCDGGKSAIKKWSGKGNSASNLADGDGYNNSSTDHKALQVAVSQNRLILISPYEENASGLWIENYARIRWPEVARLEDSAVSGSAWNTSNAGAGFVDLNDTADINVWASLLGNTLMVYQKHSLWQLRYVGGTDVFTPDIIFPDLGLLAWGLHASTGSTHYFVGNDYNVYAYNGNLSNIGGKISELLKGDIASGKETYCRMAIGAQHKHLWIFFAGESDGYARKAYKLNMSNGSWTVRDLSNKYTAGGIGAARLMGGATYTVGQTYAQAVTEGTSYAEAAAGTEIATTETETATTWDAAGKVMTGTGSNWATGANEVVPGNIVHVQSGTGATTGYYAVATVASDTSMTLLRSIGSSPSSVDYDIYDNDGDSYASTISEVLVDEKLMIGDTSGYVLKEDPDVTTDDSVEPTRYHITKEFDGGSPEVVKRIDGIAVDAKGSNLTLEYSIDDGSWTSISTITLDSTFTSYKRFINRSGKKIQLRLSWTGNTQIRSFGFFDAKVKRRR